MGTGKTIPFSHVVKGKDGRLYRVFLDWRGLYQYMMQEPYKFGAHPATYNGYAHCAIITINEHLAIELWETGNGKV